MSLFVTLFTFGTWSLFFFAISWYYECRSSTPFGSFWKKRRVLFTITFHPKQRIFLFRGNIVLLNRGDPSGRSTPVTTRNRKIIESETGRRAHMHPSAKLAIASNREKIRPLSILAAQLELLVESNSTRSDFFHHVL